MGCDIHAHIEVKLDDKWEHYSHLYIERSYALFGKIAGVRSDEFDPVAEPRGLPEDMSVVTAFDAKLWEGDMHSTGWLTADEMEDVRKWYQQRVGYGYPGAPFGYLFGNYFAEKECRLVFWFDN